MKAYCLAVEHQYGLDVIVARTRERAWGELSGYVEEWWDVELPNISMPASEMAAIERYFELVSDEWLWEVGEVVVLE